MFANVLANVNVRLTNYNIRLAIICCDYTFSHKCVNPLVVARLRLANVSSWRIVNTFCLSSRFIYGG